MNSLKSKGEFMIKEKELKKIRDNFLSDSLSEQETRRIISQTYNDHKILVDPHTAIGIGVAKKGRLYRPFFVKYRFRVWIRCR